MCLAQLVTLPSSLYTCSFPRAALVAGGDPQPIPWVPSAPQALHLWSRTLFALETGSQVPFTADPCLVPRGWLAAWEGGMDGWVQGQDW